MDQRRAAGALLALVVCIASTAAAPTVSNQTGLDLYDGSAEGCYYNFQHYGEGDRIMTNEPCLNCTCHNRMLMCYLRVCPFTKPIGQDCTVEKRADQCCPIVTCPDVPVDLLTSTSTTSPAEYGATGLGKLDKYGCSINGKYFPEGSKVPPTPNKPCEHCYCIRNMTTCVMQECTLHVDGCTPIYHKDVCCPVRYSCDHPEDSTLLLDDMTTTVRPTPGFLLTTTTLSPVTQMSQDCVHDDQIFPDGALIKTEKACEHCYCMKGDIVCVVQECGTPMENEGKNCTSQPPREGQCCPDTYICEGDESTTEPSSEFTTQYQLEELTTISPPRRVGVEGSGYRIEPDEHTYTESPSMETEPEGSGYEQATEPAAVDDSNLLLTSESPEISTEPSDESLYSSKTTIRTPTLEEVEKTTEPDKGLNTVPSDAFDEEIYKPSITEKAPHEIPQVTETTTDIKTEDSDMKITTPEEAFMPIATTKREEISTTTESAFRKEDAFGEPTEMYDLGEPDKISTQATDIEKETEEDVTSSKTKAPFMEELEKQTTLSSEFTQKDIESTTEPALAMTTSVDAKPTDKLTTDSVELMQTETTKPTMEKEDLPETTSSEQNEIEDISTTLPPGRIPGEGDCLLNDVTYRNNSNVPSSNNCHTSCRCVSSIIKCDPIICSPPPEYMDNCQPTYDSPDSCCPTYVCHTGETMPPQPHSQMSGTDSPLSSSPIECHGDECEVRKEDNVPIVGDCGSAGCGDGHSGIPQSPPQDCQDGKCVEPATPCVDGNCQDTPVTHCENGKCGIEPEILPVKDIPLCGNESECKGIAPEVTPCEGEGCVSVNVECSGTDCTTDVVKQPCVDGNCQETPAPQCENGKCDIDSQIVPDKDTPLCENGSNCAGTVPEVALCEGEGCVSINVECSGTDCSTDVIKQPTDETVQPCTETSCRRKETGEVDSSLPSDCSGTECIQNVPSQEDHINELSTEIPVTEITDIKSTQQLEMSTVRYEIQTESPESQSKPSDDSSEHQPTEIIETALNEGSTSAPLPQATEEESNLGTESSAQPDYSEAQLDKEDTATKLPQMVQDDLSTSEPHISVTDETRISDTDATTNEPQVTATKQEGEAEIPVTETQDVTSKVEESHDTITTQQPVHSESTESSYVPELHDTRTAVPQELSTSVPDTDDTTTVLAEHHEEYSTKAPEQEQTESSIPHISDESDIPKVTEKPVLDTSEIDMVSTKLPELDEVQDITKSYETEVTDVSSHDVTESNEIVEKATKAPPLDMDEHKMTTELFQYELTTEEATLVSEQQEALTTKSSEDTSDVSSESPDIHKTEKPVQTESPEFSSDETIGEVPVSEIESGTTSALPSSDTDKVKVTTLPSDTNIMEESTTQASLLEEKTTMSQPAEKPIHGYDEKEQPTESPETNEVTQDTMQESSEKPGTPSTQEDLHAVKPEVTEKPDTISTELPGDGYKPERVTEPAQDITEQQEISTEEPSISAVTDEIPSEPFIPVHPETTPELATAQPDIGNEIPDVEPDTQTPATNENVEMDTKIPDRSDMDDATEASEPDVPEAVTEIGNTQPPVHSETPVVEEIHKDEQPQTTEKPVVDEVYVTEQQEKESVTTEKIKEQPSEGEYEKTSEPEKYTTVSAIQETTIASEVQKDELTIKPEVTESETLYTTSAPESHVKEPQEPVTEISGTFTTDSHDIGVSEPHEKLSPDETITEGIHEVSTGTPLKIPVDETPDVLHTDEKPESPEDAYTRTSDESSTVLLEIATAPTRKVIPSESMEDMITTKSPQEDEGKAPQELATEKSEEEETSVSQSIDGSSTESPMKLDTAVTEPIKEMVTEATSAISLDEQEKITTDGLQETMTTVLQESPEQPQESSTRMPQDITSSPALDTELPEKYTIAVSQEGDLVTDAPEKHETEIPQEPTTGKLLEEELEMHLTTPKISLTEETESLPEQTTEHVQATERPVVHGTQEPDVADKESITDAPSTDDEDTTPDVVELEEHSHKPADEISTIGPAAEGTVPSLLEEHDEEKQKPQVTTEKPATLTEIDEEKLSTPYDEFSPDISMVTTMDLGEIPHEPTQPPSSADDQQQTDIPTTNQQGIEAGDQRLGEDTSQKEQQPTQAIPVETEKIPTEQVTESVLSHVTTMLEEVSPVTTKSTDEREEDEGLTQKPEYEKPEETPLEEKPVDEPKEEPTEKPLEEPTEKPLLEPVDETESSQKPTTEQEAPVDKVDEKPTETPLGGPTTATEEPQSEDEDKLVKPLDQAEEKPTETPEKKPQEEAEEKTTELPERKPQEEEVTTESPQITPLEEIEDRPTEAPLEEAHKTPEEKPIDETLTEKIDATPSTGDSKKPEEIPEEKPQEAPEEKPEIPEEQPQELPEEKPEIPEEKPQEQPEEKPELPEEKPQELPEEKPEIPEEQPQELPEEKPEIPEEKPQEQPEEKPEMPEDKPQELPEEKPEVPEEKPQELPEEKPEVPEEKPQELPEEKPEVPEDKPQELPEEEPEVPEEKPQELPQEQPEVPEEKPQELPEEKPEVPEEKPQELPQEQPEVPEEKPQELPEEKPEVPEEKPEVPEEKPQELPEEKPEVPEEKPQELPEEKPEVPEEKPQDVLEQKPEIPEEKPQEVPKDKPEEPEDKPQDVPEEKPEVPEEKPQELPEEKPEVPEEKPQELPQEKPEVPEEKPQELPEEKPEVPEETPQDVLEQKPEIPEEKPQEVPKDKPEEPEDKPQDVPEEKPAEPASTTSPEVSKPGFTDMQPTDEVPDDESQFPPSAGTSGYGTEPDYVEEDQAFGPGTCRYGGKVYVSAQQIPRDDPCDFCFCFRSDIICLQQSCPPPIHGCHEEPIQGFCCPRYECPVAMATTLNVTTTTTTTTTTLPPHFLPHAYKGAAQRRGCQIKGHTYKVGEVVRASSGPCLHCTCGGDGQMKCDPKACTPEPMLRQMIAAAVSAKRRR